MELNKRCGHMFAPGVFCDLEAGHPTTHKCYKKTVKFDQGGTEVAHFQVYEWDDFRQTPRGCGEHCKVFTYDDTESDRVRVLAEAIADANACLSAGTVFEIREHVYHGTGEQRSIAWFWKPLVSEMPVAYRHMGIPDEAELFVGVPGAGILGDRLGYSLVARLKATI